MKTASSLLLLALVMVTGITSSYANPNKDLDARLRKKLDLEPSAKTVRAYLKLIADEKALLARANELFKDLSNERWAVREAAGLKLNALPYIPEAALKTALASSDAEAVHRAKRVAKNRKDAALATEIAMFACLRTIATFELAGLVPELLAIAPKCESQPAQQALLAAMATTAGTAEDEKLLRAALEKAKTKTAAEKYFQWKKSGAEKAPAAPGWDRFLDTKVMNGKGEGGHKTEFVKGIPPQLHACFNARTRTASTISSVSDRRKTSPWLYPEAKWGEIPKVLEQNGQRHYPIWGTWQQHYTQGTIRLDENGSLINCEHSSDNNIHVSSSIRFLIVTK